jgi:hypothetical protein
MNAKEWLDFKSGYGQLNGYLSRHPVTIDDQAYLTDEVVCLFGVPGVKRLRSLRKAENLPAVIRDLVDHMRENEGVRPSDETVRLKQQLRGVVPYESRGDKRARRDTEAEVKAKESTARAKVAEQAQREAERQRDLAEREAKARAQAAERAQLEAERERDLAVERAAKVEAAILKPMVSTAPSNVPQSEADRLEADLHRIELEIRSTEAALKILRQRAKTVRGSLAALRPVAAAS